MEGAPARHDTIASQPISVWSTPMVENDNSARPAQPPRHLVKAPSIMPGSEAQPFAGGIPGPKLLNGWWRLTLTGDMV